MACRNPYSQSGSRGILLPGLLIVHTFECQGNAADGDTFETQHRWHNWHRPLDQRGHVVAHTLLDRANERLATAACNHTANNDQLRIDQRHDLREPHRQQVNRFIHNLLADPILTKDIGEQIGIVAKLSGPP